MTLNSVLSFLLVLFAGVCNAQYAVAVAGTSVGCDTTALVSRIGRVRNYNWRFGTLGDATNIYCAPDTGSTVLRVLPFGTPVQSVPNQDTIENQGKVWYKVFFKNDNAAYIKEEDLAEGGDDFYGNGYGFLWGQKPGYDSLGRKHFVIRRHKTGTPNALETFECNYLDGFEIQPLYLTTLKCATAGSIGNHDSAHIFFRYRTFTNSCPGVTNYVFIADNGKRLKKVTASASTGEGDEFNDETVYLPVQFGNGKILLVADGDVEHIFDVSTASLRVFPYPENCGVPINNLIVKTKDKGTYVTDANDHLVRNKDGTYKIKSEVKSTEFYSWDGNKVTRMPSPALR